MKFKNFLKILNYMYYITLNTLYFYLYVSMNFLMKEFFMEYTSSIYKYKDINK